MYTPNIPTANQFQSTSQPLIQQNFISLAPFQEGVANFPLVADPVTTSTSIALYAKAVAGVPQLFIRQASSGAITNITSAIAANAGETVLPSGIKIKWGRGLTPATGTIGILTFTFAGLGLTNFTNIFSFQATAASATSPVITNENQSVARVNSYSTTGATVATIRIGAIGGNPNSANFTWFAIGN